MYFSFPSGGGREEMELFSDVFELYGLLLFIRLYLASVISSHTCPGQLSAEDTEKPSVDLSSMRFCAVNPSLSGTVCCEFYLPWPPFLVSSIFSTQRESQVLFGFPLFIIALIVSQGSKREQLK